MAMNNGNSRTWLWVVIGGGAFFLFVMAVFTLVYIAVKSDQKTTSLASGFGDKIAVVDLEGIIFDSRPYIEVLKRYEKDDSVKAIVLRINSPGGGAAASKEIFQYVKRIAAKHKRDKKNKPIIAFISEVGASGGYYVAIGCNKVFANDSSIVGSIGVIAQWINYSELMKWAKLKDETFKSGSLKDAGNPGRDMTPEERAYLQGIIDDMHSQFVRNVAEGRGLKEEDVRPLANGRVWTGLQAQPLKLVDQLADFEGAVEDTARSVGILGEPVLVSPTKDQRTLLDILFSDMSDVLPDKAKLMQTHVGFYYLWK